MSESGRKSSTSGHFLALRQGDFFNRRAQRLDIINARCRYRGTSQEYSRFSKAIGIPQQRERVTIDGLGNIGAGKYTKAVAKSEKSGIINKYKGKGLKVEKSSEIPVSVVTSVEEAAKKVTSDFKILEEYSEPITFGDAGTDAFASNEFMPSTGKNKITLSKTAFSNPTELENCLKQDYINGASYEVTGIESLVAHEIGHNAHIALALKRAGLQYGSPIGTLETAILKREYNKISQEIYLAAFTDEKFLQIQGICVEELGWKTYCNPRELVAQSFGNYYFGVKKSRTAEIIVKYFLKELG